MKSFIRISIFLGLCLVVLGKKDLLLEEYGPLGTKADFYQDEYLAGSSHYIELEAPGNCKNLPKRWQKKPLSVDTRGTCISACDALDCGGTCKRIYPNWGEQQLKQVGMDKKIVAFKSCFI